MTVHYPEKGHDWCAAVEDNSFWFRHRNQFLLEVMRRYPPRTPLYDVGGGNGVVAAALQQAGIPAVVVEPGADGARRAKLRGLESICATLGGAGFTPGSLPSVGLFDVIEHIEDPVAFLRQAFDLMKPGGRIYLAVPAYVALWSAEDDYARHFRRYTRRGLSRELAAAGFEIEHSTYMFAFLILPILLMRSLPYRLGVSRPVTPDAVRSDHVATGASRALLDRLRNLEVTAVRRWGGLPFGASVVAVARKPGER